MADRNYTDDNWSTATDMDTDDCLSHRDSGIEVSLHDSDNSSVTSGSGSITSGIHDITSGTTSLSGPLNTIHESTDSALGSMGGGSDSAPLPSTPSVGQLSDNMLPLKKRKRHANLDMQQDLVMSDAQRRTPGASWQTNAKASQFRSLPVDLSTHTRGATSVSPVPPGFSMATRPVHSVADNSRLYLPAQSSIQSQALHIPDRSTSMETGDIYDLNRKMAVLDTRLSKLPGQSTERTRVESPMVLSPGGSHSDQVATSGVHSMGQQNMDCTAMIQRIAFPPGYEDSGSHGYSQLHGHLHQQIQSNVQLAANLNFTPRGLKTSHVHQQGLLDGHVHQQGRPDGHVHQQGRPDGHVHQQGRPDGHVHQQGRLDGYVHQQGRPDGHVHQQGRLDGHVHQQRRPDGHVHQQGRPDGNVHTNERPLHIKQAGTIQVPPIVIQPETTQSKPDAPPTAGHKHPRDKRTATPRDRTRHSNRGDAARDKSDVTDAECRMVAEADEDGDLPLHIAVVQNEVVAVDRLLHIMKVAKADIDHSNLLKQTPLHLATITKDSATMKKLLCAGASPNNPDRKGQTCCHLAVNYNSTECLKTIFEHTKYTVDIDARNYEGLTALHRAVQLGHVECGELLLKYGSEINLMDGKSGKTPLYLAFECNQAKSADMLIQRGADVNIPTYSGSTVIQAANSKGQQLITRLIEGADANLTNSSVRELQNKLSAKASRSRNRTNNTSSLPLSGTKRQLPPATASPLSTNNQYNVQYDTM